MYASVCGRSGPPCKLHGMRPGGQLLHIVVSCLGHTGNPGRDKPAMLYQSGLTTPHTLTSGPPAQDLPAQPPSPWTLTESPGDSKLALTRQYNGETVEVRVMADEVSSVHNACKTRQLRCAS